MKLSKTTSGIWLAAGAMVASLFLPIVATAQVPAGTAGGAATSNTLTQRDADLVVNRIMEKSLGDPRADKAYQTFHSAKQTDQKIKLGEAYINQYPNDQHIEAAYEELAGAYYSNKDLANFYTCSNKGLSLYPDDVMLLTLTGWVIPRAYTHDDPDAEAKLDKAETYEKHAIDVLKTLKKPVSFSDQQFDLYKTQESATAHSALGLIYFRRAEFEDSLKEIQESTKSAPSPDPTDFLVLGADLQNLSRFTEAAEAFNRCAQIAGPFQADCKLNADRATKQAAQTR